MGCTSRLQLGPKQDDQTINLKNCKERRRMTGKGKNKAKKLRRSGASGARSLQQRAKKTATFSSKQQSFHQAENTQERNRCKCGQTVPLLDGVANGGSCNTCSGKGPKSESQKGCKITGASAGTSVSIGAAVKN